MVRVVTNGLRNLLGIRRERRLPRRTYRPALGARIVRDDVRMTVQPGLSADLWRWMQEQGWREVQVRPDRRRYRDVPPSLVTALIDAAPEDWDRVMAVAVAQARRQSDAG